MKAQQTTYLSLGSNQGNRLQNLQKAINCIGDSVGDVLQIASVYETSSWGFDSHDFLNTCIEVATYLTPQTVMDTLLEIEIQLGRKRTDSNNYSDRTIDLDILLFEDEVILSKNIAIPHPRMLERTFVLVPLAEIAKEVQHPLQKQKIQACLENCSYTASISLFPEKLKRPIVLTEKYNYIAIEGNIGVGKTSLANRIFNQFDTKIVLERFAENPFLPKFYQEKERYAFPLEMSFLADRYQQITDDLAQLDLTKNSVVSDYYIFKSLIFAQITLTKEEYTLYKKMFDVLYKNITKPNIYVYLYQNTDRLLANIKKRGRDYEQNITSEYLEKIHQGYLNFIKTQPSLNTLIIEVSEWDFVNNDVDYLKVLQKIKNF